MYTLHYLSNDKDRVPQIKYYRSGIPTSHKLIHFTLVRNDLNHFTGVLFYF
jgi:hypothetical protein